MNPFALALEAGHFSVEKVCSDCVMAKENGDISGNDPNWDLHRHAEILTTYDARIGHPHTGEWWTDCPHHGQPCPDDADCDCGRDTYSTIRCAMCGDYRSGERQDYIFVERSLL